MLPEIASHIGEYLTLYDLITWREITRNDGDYISKIVYGSTIDKGMIKIMSQDTRLIKKYFDNTLKDSIGNKVEFEKLRIIYEYVNKNVNLVELMKTHDAYYEWFARMLVCYKLNINAKNNDRYKTVWYDYSDEDEYKVLCNAHCEDHFDNSKPVFWINCELHIYFKYWKKD